MLSYAYEKSRSYALAQHRLALDEKERANMQLQQATKKKGEFLANISHGLFFYVVVFFSPFFTILYPLSHLSCTRIHIELRTPLHGIMAMATSLLSSLRQQQQQQQQQEQQQEQSQQQALEEGIAIVSQCADHLLSLVASIIDFEQMEAGVFHLNREFFSVAKQVKKVIFPPIYFLLLCQPSCVLTVCCLAIFLCV